MSTVNKKMTAIADAIRMYTGGAEPLSLDAMEEGIHISNTYTKEHYLFEGRMLGFEEGKASVQEVHKITIAEDNASSTAVATWWLTNNEFVKKHYTDDGFILQLISLQAHADGDALCYAYNGNRQIMALGENNVCGFRLSRTTSNTTNVATVNGNCLSSGYTGIPYVKADGSVVSIHRSGNTALKAGDYLLILSVAEV